MNILNRFAVLGLTGALVAACANMDGDTAKPTAAKAEAKPAAAKPAEKKTRADEKYVIYFDFGKAAVNEAGATVAYRLMADTMNGYKAVLLTGHTDTAGDKKLNRKLSEKRVENVKQMFSEIGIDPSKIITQFFGEDEPAEKTADGVKNDKNRRVNVVLKF
ncbi:MAG: OmpA family protein [Rhodospirillales bacterium]|tara:strand:+ start:722 stop:1204 length:483 start_codon:yes stop_codon:yes gene_type:complete